MVSQQHQREQGQKDEFQARKRLIHLLDEESFFEIGQFRHEQRHGHSDNDQTATTLSVVTGYGTIGGRLVYVFSQNPEVAGGAVAAAKIGNIVDMALKMGAPVIGLYDSAGVSLQDGVDALAGYSDLFMKQVAASGVIPQLGAILGPCIGAGAFGPALSDFVCMVETGSCMYLSGPEVIHAASGVELSSAELGGAAIHSEITGESHFLCKDENHCLMQLRELVNLLPLNNLDDPLPGTNRDDPHRKTEEINQLIENSGDSGYDIRELIRAVADHQYWLEVSSTFASNLVTGLARLDGRSVAIVANQPQEMAGVLDIDAARKGARFVRFCNAFNLPLIVLEDVPGFLPGRQQEHDGIVRAAAQLLYAMAEATVPKLTVIVRRAYGGACCIMNPKALRADLVVAYPGADIGLTNTTGAAAILKSEDVLPVQNSARYAATTGYLDAVIDPADTRRVLISALTMASNKRDLSLPRKHGNIRL